ncbi:MAG: VWA domain-containing protein [Ardenticatenaceae bacterium]|nr:VWA domain-containing protein [Ardenticatenaceae bacterium]
MKLRNFRGIFVLLTFLGLVTIACGLSGGDGDSGPPRNAVVINVMANTSLTPWLETAVANFNAAKTENAAGDPVYVQLTSTEAGQAVSDLPGGSYDMWIPDEQVWVNVLADQGDNDFQGDCVSVAQSPLVIGMWRDVAEALGWPGLQLGWLDMGSLAADPAAWDYYSGGDFGESFRLGHTHPGLSGTGTSTLLALVQAAQSKTNAVSTADIDQPIVQASVGAFEGGVAWFSNSSDALGATMSSRDISYLSAAVMYEATVVHYGNGRIVPIYPLEGTFMADFPACISQSGDGEAARIFRDYLLGEEGQGTAVTYGLRPVNNNVSVGFPLDSSNGIDLEQPAIVFNNPSVETIYAVQELWQSARKDVNLVMLLDTSGSMRGDKIDNMKAAAVQFVENMGDDDYISLIAFSTEPQLIVSHVRIGDTRAKVINEISNLRATGDTTLFDAIGDGAQLASETTRVDTANALVVLTDGEDTRSYRYRFDQTLIDAVLNSQATVFTIAYGSDADEGTLSAIASEANGNFYLGDEASIEAIYEEMSAAFGGSAGVGR